MNPPSDTALDLQSLRARKARLSRKIGRTGFELLLVASLLLICCSVALFLIKLGRWGYITLAPALAALMYAIWYRQDLVKLPPTGQQLTEQLSGDVLSLLDPKAALTPESVWRALSRHWQVNFFANHLLIPKQMVEEQIGGAEADMAVVWNEASQLAKDSGCAAIEPGHVAAAMLITSPAMHNLLAQMRLSINDVEAINKWLGRLLENMRADKPYFGGIGRDWANGFTPQLDQYGTNISLTVENGGGHYEALVDAPGVSAIKNAFSQGAAAVALIGPNGIGKTSHVYALAQALLTEKNDLHLEHRQIIGLNPSLIISSAQHPGELETIVLRLMQETAHAGHVIVFLDDAQLFFGGGPGSFDATQILLPIIQSRAVQIVFAMTPNDYQNLKTKNSSFAALLTPVVLTEPDQTATMRILEDSALSFENRHKLLISYEALLEAYRLSGRYEQDLAYPGKAILLLEQSLPHAAQQTVTAASVQQAIQQTRGVKAGSASPMEADALLHLEDNIHSRMINQTRAVTVVSNALRRARAGVANPRRPIGSFLFLGPTGVGKTELAKAIAATYFGDESNMIRLDMSEYQQPEDVDRLLSDGGGQASSLLMAVRQQPFNVVLLDEIEKSHPNILNLLLQLLDEGQLTDSGGRAASFKDCVVIATSNAGAQEIREHVTNGETLESFEPVLIDSLIKSNMFKPELLNRFDEIVLFRPLNQDELLQVVSLMMRDINKTLSNQNITVELTQAAAQQIVIAGYDARLGARPMRRMLQRTVEDEIANRILRGTARPGDHVVLDAPDLSLTKS
jgi:ATP-dependent Clp protease ATP-binding subunit ClpC